MILRLSTATWSRHVARQALFGQHLARLGTAGLAPSGDLTIRFRCTGA